MPYIRLKVNEEGILHKLLRFLVTYSENSASQVVLVVKTPANAEVIRDLGLIPGSGRSPGGGHGNPLQYSCLENSMDRGAWQVTVRRMAKSRTRLKQLSKHACTHSENNQFRSIAHIIHEYI